FLEGYFLLQLGDEGGGHQHLRLGLLDSQRAYLAGVTLQLYNLQGAVVELQVPLGHFQLGIQHQQVVIAFGNLGHQTRLDGFPRFKRLQVVGQGTLALPPQLAPDVELPAHGNRREVLRLVQKPVLGRCLLVAIAPVPLGRGGAVEVARPPLVVRAAQLGVYLRQQRRARLPQRLVGDLDVFDGRLHVVVVRNGAVDQQRQHAVREKIFPRDIGNGRGVIRRRGATERVSNLQVGADIVFAYLAGGYQQAAGNDNESGIANDGLHD